MEKVEIGRATLYVNKRHRKGADHPLYKGGKSKDGNGYITCCSGPNKGKREHRVVMEQLLDRPLASNEIVHHINGNKADNSPENLRLETRQSHNRVHGKGALLKCCDCGKERWYSSSLIKKCINKNGPYRCRACWVANGGNAECLRKK